MARYVRNLGGTVPLPLATPMVTRKEWKRTNCTFLMFNLPDKNSQQRKTVRHCRTPRKSNVVSIGCYVWLLSTRLHANRDCLLNLYMAMLGKSARTASRKCLRRAYFIWLAEGVATILCCAKLVFMLFTISLKRFKTLHFVLLGKCQLKEA